MYAEDMDLCWRLQMAGWRRRLESDIAVHHVANAAGRQAWGETRTQRWWEATYDWYRFRRGVPAARRWAMMNTLGVTKLLCLARLNRRFLGARVRPATVSRISELEQVLPIHAHMRRAPQTAFLPDQAPVQSEDG
jgi:GT2 family glycosyltransferase